MRTIENCTPLASVSLSQLIVGSGQTTMIEVMVSDWVDLDSRNSMLVRLLTMWLLGAQNCQLLLDAVLSSRKHKIFRFGVN